MRLVVAISIVGLLLVGCANPVNERTALRYTAEGDRARSTGDWHVAKEAYSRALVSARIGHLGPDAEATIAMKLGVALGNLCEHDAAEDAFLMAITAGEKAYGKDSPATFPVRVELAQHAYDTEQHAKAVTYFEQAFAVGGSILEEKDPASYAELLDDYSDALAAIGKPTAADEAKRRAEVLRTSGSGSPSQVAKSKTSYVRYSKSCT